MEVQGDALTINEFNVAYNWGTEVQAIPPMTDQWRPCDEG
jgi:hypothetical protein